MNRAVSTLALTLILALIPAAAHAPMKHIPPKPKVEQRAKQEPRRVMFEVTAYTANDKGMNGKGITASGRKAIPWRTVAVSRSIPLGTRIYVPALKRIFVVHDRGSKKWIDKKNGMDIFVRTKEEAKRIGRRKLEGVILE